MIKRLPMEKIHTFTRCFWERFLGRMESPSSWKVVKLLFLRKPDAWLEERNPVLRHGTVVRPTMHLASLDIKTAFDEATPKHVAKFFDDHNTHGWIIAALLREMSGLSGKDMFEFVESSFAFNRCLRQGSVEAPRLCQKMATQMLANVEEEWMKQR